MFLTQHRTNHAAIEYVIGSRNRAFGPSFRLGEPPWRGKRPTPRASPIIPTLHRVIPDLQCLQIIRTRFIFGVMEKF